MQNKSFEIVWLSSLHLIAKYSFFLVKISFPKFEGAMNVYISSSFSIRSLQYFFFVIISFNFTN